MIFLQMIQKIIKKYVSNPKIKIIFNKKKIGLLKSSNIAIKASKGEFVIRLDADDYFDKNLISIFIKKIKKILILLSFIQITMR